MNSRGIQIKSAEQIQAMRIAGLVVSDGLIAMAEAARAGVTTAEIDAVGRKALADRGATSSFLKYGAEWGIPPYPAVACISVNEQVVHGIPGERTLAESDIVSIDFGAIVDGWHGDAARTCIVGGHTTPAATELVEKTRTAMWDGIAAIWSAKRIGDVSAAIQASANGSGMPVGIVRDYTGHGIGTAMHQEPDVPNYGRARRGPKIVPGMCLAIEPILTIGSAAVVELDDEWTVVTEDGSWAAHWENTVAITEDGLWVLTEPDGGKAELSARGVPVNEL